MSASWLPQSALEVRGEHLYRGATRALHCGRPETEATIVASRYRRASHAQREYQRPMCSRRWTAAQVKQLVVLDAQHISLTVVVHHDAASTDRFDEVIFDHRRTNANGCDANAVTCHREDAIVENLATRDAGVVKPMCKDNSIVPLSGFCRSDVVIFEACVISAYDDPKAARVNFVFTDVES